MRNDVLTSPGNGGSLSLQNLSPDQRRLRMAHIVALWLPILLSAVIVFIASSVMHVVLTYHNSDFKPIPEEDKVSAALRTAAVPPGYYMFPYCNHKQMKSPEMQEKFK